MKPLLAILVLALASCTHWTVPPRAIPAPIQSAAVTPAVDAVRADSAKGREISGRLETQVDALRKSSADLRNDFALATAEADRLRKQKAATEKELDGLWLILTGTEQRAKALFEEVEKAKTIANQQKSFRLLAEHNLDELAKAAIARDTETVELRAQRDDLSKSLGKAQAAYEKQASQLATAENRAAVGTYLKGCVWVLGISILIIAALYVAVKIRLI